MGFVSAIRFVFSHFIIENDPEKIDIILSSFSQRYYSYEKNN